ncbi:MAG: hypothetical protein VXV93_05455 [Pseudomonadota bacterium]|nr:hypothetical protein [Pseudomonadota bacterium]
MSVQYVSILAAAVFMTGIAQTGLAHRCQLKAMMPAQSANIINARQI